MPEQAVISVAFGGGGVCWPPEGGEGRGGRPVHGAAPAPARPGADKTLSWSSDGGSTGKKANVSGVQAREPKSVYLEHRTREWGHPCPSEHSLMVQ